MHQREQASGLFPESGPPFAVGDRVTTDYEPGREWVRRHVMRCYPAAPKRTQTGWLVDADGGAPGRRGLVGLDSAWYRKVEG